MKVSRSVLQCSRTQQWPLRLLPRPHPLTVPKAQMVHQPQGEVEAWIARLQQSLSHAPSEPVSRLPPELEEDHSAASKLLCWDLPRADSCYPS